MRNIILWNYSRGTWQYDLFCVLIVGFIFLTPNTWFDNGEKMATRSGVAHVKAEDFSQAGRRFEISEGISTGDTQKRISPD